MEGRQEDVWTRWRGYRTRKAKDSAMDPPFPPHFHHMMTVLLVCSYLLDVLQLGELLVGDDEAEGLHGRVQVRVVTVPSTTSHHTNSQGIVSGLDWMGAWRRA